MIYYDGFVAKMSLVCARGLSGIIHTCRKVHLSGHREMETEIVYPMDTRVKYAHIKRSYGRSDWRASTGRRMLATTC
jgi:hypothetical protein